MLDLLFYDSRGTAVALEGTGLENNVMEARVTIGTTGTYLSLSKESIQELQAFLDWVLANGEWSE